MAQSHVISGLVARRSELAGLVEYHKKTIERLVADMKALDTSIKLFMPEFDLAEIKSKKFRHHSRLFKLGECYRLTLESMREHGGTSTGLAISDRIMKIKEFAADQHFVVSDSVKRSLNKAEKTGLLRRTGMDGHTIVWTLN